MATTMLAGTPVVAAEAASASASAGGTVIGELIVTANKRAEDVQKVPLSIQVIDQKLIRQLNITNFQDYVKFMPNVNYESQAPNQTTIFMRGVSDGGNANHSGPLPSVGTYVDEQPITTIGGTLDFHPYDISRVEVLPGPQGTLYGASSESGTLRFITNQPSAAKFSAGYDIQGNLVDHGAPGGVLEGFVNIPVASNVAIRLVAFGERDGGYIDNVYGTRTFRTSGVTINNASYVANNFNSVSTVGGRAALKVDLNDNWTVTPTVMGQEAWAAGVFGYEPAAGTLNVNRFTPDRIVDKWLQAALNINGRIGNWDLNYSGGYFTRHLNSESDYTDYSVAYDQAFAYGASWVDANGHALPTPIQQIFGADQFEKESNELRVVSPGGSRFRFVAGLFQERQQHHIIQDYQIQGFGPQVSVTGWPNTIWLTNQERIDRDEAIFGQASFDITHQLTLTGGIRGYHYDNTLYGFYGYSANFSSHTGESQCIAGLSFSGAPCVDLRKGVSAYGATYKANLEYKIDDTHMVYFTFSTGYRPGGVNRRDPYGPYQSDTLYNYEVGWKTAWLDHSLTWDGALYDEQWSNFQFAFLGPASLTIVENAPSARVLGAETSLTWRATQSLTFSGGAAYNNAELSKNFCGAYPDGTPIPTCSNADAEAVAGQPLPWVPKFKGNLTARYTFPVMSWTGHVQASVLYQTSAPATLLTNNINEPKPPGAVGPNNDVALLGNMPGYVTADFALGAEHGNLAIELFVKNAFDQIGQQNRYTPCTISVCARAYPAAGIPPAVYVTTIPPLTVGIKFGQKF